MKTAKPIIEAPFINYFTIAADAYSRMEDYLKKDGIQWPAIGKFHQSAIGQAIVVLVFTIITLGSFINNYAARKFGNSFVKKEMKNMSLYRKWSFVPERVTGRALPDDRGMQMLKQMITMRNSIVHTKSSQISWEDFHETFLKRKTQNNTWETRIVSASRGAFECIGLLGQRLLTADPDEPFAIMFSRLANKQQ